MSSRVNKAKVKQRKPKNLDLQDNNTIDYGKNVNKLKNVINFEKLNKKTTFLSYFDAWKNKKAFTKTDNNDINSLNFQVENYNNILELLKSDEDNLYKKCTFSSKEEQHIDAINRIDKESLFKLITEMILMNKNVLIYGYGSKLELIYEYIKYFQEKVNTTNVSSISKEENLSSNNNDDPLAMNKWTTFKKPYFHITVINAFNPEVKFSLILEAISNYIFSYNENQTDIKKLLNTKNDEAALKSLITLIEKKDEKLDLNFKGKILMIINSIDGPSLLSKKAQKNLSLLVTLLDITLLATCDNLFYCYYWSQEVKDYFSFCFLKYNSFKSYEYEINDKFSITGEKTVKSGAGFASIFKSLTDKQRKMIKLIGEYQISDNKNISNLSFKVLTDILIDNAIVGSTGQVKSMLFEPLDHDVIIERTNNKNKNHYYKLNLSIEVIHNLINGDFDNLD